jgi:hypothetical protein
MSGIKIVKRILVAGGGTAGWLAASYLSKNLDTPVSITLIESPTIPTIGVGEGTVPTFKSFLSKIGIYEEDWMGECNASYKIGIRFDDWYEKNTSWWHAFAVDKIANFSPNNSPSENINNFDILYSYVYHQIKSNNKKEIHKDLLNWTCAQDNYIATNSPSPSGFHNAYHFDASCFSQYLKKKSTESSNIQYISDDILGCDLNSSGEISSVKTRNHGKIEADLFIDCTGFKRVLLNAVSSPRYITYANELLCDRAIILPIPYENKNEELKLYTISKAMSAGWTWKIFLQNRIGIGYVYSSAFISDEQAENELREYLGKDRVKSFSSRIIPFSPGRVETPWVKNCVGLGLAEGFFEPIEATAIYLTTRHISVLHSILNDQWLVGYNSRNRLVYNNTVEMSYNETKRFITAHYYFCNHKNLPFWKAVQSMTCPDLDLLTEDLETVLQKTCNYQIFPLFSWLSLLLGLNSLPKKLGTNLEVGNSILEQEMLEKIENHPQWGKRP